ncbi:MAG: hypothetical protein ACO1Q7_13945 [Gemmatimonas sp.]
MSILASPMATVRKASVRRALSLACAGVSAVALAGCLDLQVDNPNTLNRDSVFNNASNTEAALVGGWRRYFYVMHAKSTGSSNSANCPAYPLGIYANEIVTTSATYIEFGQEPRNPIDNLNTLNCATRGPWYEIYSSIAAGRDAVQGIAANGLKWGTVDATTPNGKDTPSRIIFGKFLIALGQLELGLMYDKAFITDATTPSTSTGGDLKPYQEVVANAITQMQAVIAEAKSVPDFTLPTTWINGRTISRDEFVRICNSYIVRGLVYAPRTPAERAAVDWNRVLTFLDAGITTVDFAQQADPAISATSSTWIDISYAQNTLRISNRLIGPADTSGQYQAWLNAPLSTRAKITITTPDRRIHGATNTAAGTRFTYLTTAMGSEALGTYVASKYRSNRYLNATSDSGTKALILMMPVQEMRFIRAEAFYRLNRLTEAAALINPTRIAAQLKPVDANGPPAGRDCVPRKDDGSCGDLFDAIQYEKRIELYPLTENVPYYDQRGWGKLVKGTPIHFPVSGRELKALGLEYYTFGGSGPGSAP